MQEMDLNKMFSEFTSEIYTKHTNSSNNCEDSENSVSLEIPVNVLDSRHVTPEKYQLIYTECTDDYKGAVNKCDGQFQELGSLMYTIHIQEPNEELCATEVIYIEEPAGVEDTTNTKTLTSQDYMLEAIINAVKSRETYVWESGDAQNLKETSSNCTTVNGNIIQNKSSNEAEEQNPQIKRMYLGLTEETVFAAHGLDMSLPVVCDICNIDFDDVLKFDEHMKGHIETKFFMCQLCSKTYVSWQNLVAHRKVLHNGQFISCDDCTRRKMYYDLGPISYPVGEFPIGCEECQEGFLTVNALNRHYRLHATQKQMDVMEKTNSECCNEKTKIIEVHNKVNKNVNSSMHNKDVKMSVGANTEKSFKCNTCRKEISSLKVYVAHKRLHADINVNYKCPHCTLVFSDMTIFTLHIGSHASTKQYECTKCSRKFENKASLDVHKYCHLIPEKYQCFNCQMDFGTSSDLAHHIKNIHNTHPDRKLICDICTSHHTVDKFMEHYLLCHAELKCQKATTKNEDGIICEVCFMVFSHPKEWFRHMKIHGSAKQTYLCEVCGMTIEQWGPFIAHIRSHGKEYNRNFTALNGTHKENMLNNEERTNKIKSFMCEYCGKVFKNSSNLKLHVQKHKEEKPYDCNMCTMAFYSGEQLSVHMRQHTGERPYECAVCKKTFASSGVLYAHKRLHRSVKQHVCPVCNKNFLWHSTYRNHMKIHSGIQPFKCEECSKTFVSKYKLTAHKKTHGKKKLKTLNHQCSDCGQSFTAAIELQNHHENKCYLSMMMFMPPSDIENKESSPLILLNPNDDNKGQLTPF